MFSLEKAAASREKKRARDSPMNLDPAPRVSKTVFLLIDAGLLVTAFIIAYLVKDPFAPVPFVLTVLCVALAGIIGLVPFLLDYAADSAEYIQAERAKVADHVQRLNAASESLARAAAQIKAVEEAVHKTAHAAENLPYRMQEKLAEFNQQLATTDDEEKERLSEELATLRQGESERLATIADKIHKATAELSALEAATRKSLAAAQDSAVSKFESRLTAALTALDAKLATLTIPVAAAPAPAAPAPAPVAEKQPEPITAAPSVVESVSVTEAPAPAAAVEEPKPKKPRAPRKPKPEDTLAAMSEPMPGDVPAESSGEPAFADAPAESASAPSEDSQAEAAATVEPSVSADGATRLLVTAYIGIGNKLYIRGDGPGLSWDKGVPMKFVSIGKWGWATDEATGPVACKLYKNDETAALSGEVFLEPGQHVEVTALF